MFDSIVSALGSIASPVISGLSSMGNSAMSYGFSKKMAKLNAELSLENALATMGAQHSYNRSDYNYSLKKGPSLTRKGLEAAGFNPMLALGDLGHMESPVSGASAGFGSPSVDFGVGDLGAAYDRGANSASQRKEQQKQVERLDKLTDAELEKLKAESRAAIAHSGAAMYRAETERLEADARIEKIKKEADSIEPEVIKRHNRYGTSSFGRAIEDVTLKVSDALDINRQLREAKSRLLKKANSAKGAKVISDAVNREEKRRGDAVRNRRKHH